MIENSILVIVTPGRSGSEHLLQTLNSCAGIKLESEVFNQSNFIPASFNGFINSNVWYKTFGFFFNRQKLSKCSLNFGLSFLIDKYITTKFNDATCIWGFKLTLDQLDAYPHLWKILKSNSTKILYLTKKDKLALILSLIKARKTNRYHSTSISKNTPYSFNSHEVVKQLNWLQKNEMCFLDFLKPHPHFLHITSENMFQNYDKVLNDIIKFLDLQSDTSFQYSKLKPTNPAQLDDWVTNIAEIRASLSNME